MRSIVCKDQYFTTWVSSKPIEKPFVAPMVELHLPSYRTGVTAWRDLYDKYQVSQIKRQFLDCGRFFNTTYPVGIEYDQINIGDGSNMVDFSGFWYYPTDITVYSKLIIESDEDTTLSLGVVTNGSIMAWVDGKEAFRVLSEAVNHDTFKEVTIKVKRGENELVIGLNELGERNTMVRFGLCNKSDKSIVTTIPSNIKEEDLEGIRGFMDSLDMEQDEDVLRFSSCALTLPLTVSFLDESRNNQSIFLKKDDSFFDIKDTFSGHILIANIS